jgi:ceramide glucosyltransferase
MLTFLSAAQIALGFGIFIGSCCWLLVLLCAPFFRSRRFVAAVHFQTLPPVTLLKPVCGLEKHLMVNLRSACVQDYPDYQVIYSVQRSDDPALETLRELERQFGSERVSVVISNAHVGMNGKVNNLAGALPHARHETLVFSDSDVMLRPDFLRQIVAPLADPAVGAVSTFFRGCSAGVWYEYMEQLTLNADQFPMAMLASATGLVDFCFGASTALTKTTLAQIGGFEDLGEFLVEDTEMGRRVLALGKKLVDIPYLVDTTVDLGGPRQWWQKQTYWDQNSRVALPSLFAASVLLRTIPLALLFAALRGADSLGVWVLGCALLVRMSAVVAVLALALRDYAGLSRVWLIPIKDVLSLIWFTRAWFARRVIWRGHEMSLGRDGRLTMLSSQSTAGSENAP